MRLLLHSTSGREPPRVADFDIGDLINFAREHGEVVVQAAPLRDHMLARLDPGDRDVAGAIEIYDTYRE